MKQPNVQGPGILGIRGLQWRARDVSSLPPPAAIEARKELLGPCHSPERNIEYWIFY